MGFANRLLPEGAHRRSGICTPAGPRLDVDAVVVVRRTTCPLTTSHPGSSTCFDRPVRFVNLLNRHDLNSSVVSPYKEHVNPGAICIQ